jgi:hypothetical protein
MTYDLYEVKFKTCLLLCFTRYIYIYIYICLDAKKFLALPVNSKGIESTSITTTSLQASTLKGKHK